MIRNDEIYANNNGPDPDCPSPFLCPRLLLLFLLFLPSPRRLRPVSPSSPSRLLLLLLLPLRLPFLLLLLPPRPLVMINQ